MPADQPLDAVAVVALDGLLEEEIAPQDGDGELASLSVESVSMRSVWSLVDIVVGLAPADGDPVRIGGVRSEPGD